MKKLLFNIGYYGLVLYAVVLYSNYWYYVGKNGFEFNTFGFEYISFGIVLVSIYLARNQIKTEYYEKSISLWITVLLGIPLVILLFGIILNLDTVVFDLMGTIMLISLILLTLDFLIVSFINEKK